MTNIQTSPELIEQDKLKTVPPNGRAVELQVNLTLIAELMRKGDSYNTFKTKNSPRHWLWKQLVS